MKNLFVSILLLLSLSTLLISCSPPPDNPPNLTVRSIKDTVVLEATTTGGNWFEKSIGGNSFDLGMSDASILSSIDEGVVSCNDTLKLDLSFSKDIEYFKVYSIQQDTLSNNQLTEIESSNYAITTPSIPGEYAYVVETRWDETHSVRYIFKIVCE